MNGVKSQENGYQKKEETDVILDLSSVIENAPYMLIKNIKDYNPLIVGSCGGASNSQSHSSNSSSHSASKSTKGLENRV